MDAWMDDGTQERRSRALALIPRPGYNPLGRVILSSISDFLSYQTQIRVNLKFSVAGGASLPTLPMSPIRQRSSEPRLGGTDKAYRAASSVKW